MQNYKLFFNYKPNFLFLTLFNIVSCAIYLKTTINYYNSKASAKSSSHKGKNSTRGDPEKNLNCILTA